MIERPPAGDRTSGNNADFSIDDAVAEIAARQRALDSGAPVQQAPRAAAMPEASPPLAPHSPGVADAGGTAAGISLSGLEKHLRQITSRIDALRPTSDLEGAIAAVRDDLTEIGRILTEALPRHAVESLEIEVKALAQRIDHSRQSGVDSTAIAGLERGLAEVREALRGLTPAENLVGFDEAVKALAQKVDMIVAKDDPAAIQQLETAIGALRGIVSHVASNDTLTKVAEDVRSLAAKVDGLANSAASGNALSALETRIDSLANALTASTEAGHAVPRELEKLLAGLIEKLEWVQLTHTDHAALAHLEDRIAMLVKRFDASDARLGHLEAIERGLADLLVHIEQMRGVSGQSDGGAKPAPSTQAPVVVDAIKRDVAEIRQSERRTQDSLEAVQGTVEHVVDRLATIESTIRAETAPIEAPAKQALPPVQTPPPAQPSPASSPVALVPAPVPVAIEPAPRRATAARPPIDPNLPPDHPLEPGSAGRPRGVPSAADRIAASEAAVGPAKPPVIPDPGGRPDFIAAARRAAQAAAAAPQDKHSNANAATEDGVRLPRNLTRLRKLIVAGGAALIVVACLHIASRLFEDSSATPPEPQAGKASPPAHLVPEANTSKQPAPAPTPLAIPVPPGAPPSTTPTAAKPAKPGRQSMLQDDGQQSVAAAAPPPGNERPSANAMPLWSSDITGTLPRSVAPVAASPVPSPAPAAASMGDKLPATIGGPALRAAAIAGDPSAAYEVGMRFAAGHGVPQNSEEAARWLDRAAKKGLAPAQFRLGGLYEKGIGVKKSLTTARDLYLAAAERGNGKAMHNLAVLYAEGIDGPADYRNASHWFREAADHGITDSQYNLGILYARGIGVEQNYAESYKWFVLAANQGDKEAAKKRDEVISHLDPQSLAAARSAVQTWSPQPQPDEAVNVQAPGGASDTPGPQAAKSKPRPTAGKPAAPDSKVN